MIQFRIDGVAATSPQLVDSWLRLSVCSDQLDAWVSLEYHPGPLLSAQFLVTCHTHRDGADRTGVCTFAINSRT